MVPMTVVMIHECADVGSEGLLAERHDSDPNRPALKPYQRKPAVRISRATMETSASVEARSAPSSYPTQLLSPLLIRSL
jgi:hypothetical protein